MDEEEKGPRQRSYRGPDTSGDCLKMPERLVGT